MMGIIEQAGPWGWVIAGLVLMGIELIAPGLFFIWLGLAAVATGVIIGLFGLGWQAASVLFAVLAIASVFGGRWVTRHKASEPQPADALNALARDLVGKTAKLESDTADGEGRIRLNDTIWRVRGPAMVAGARVRVVALDGTVLVVEPA
jgi:membrane protein implicated in regulation of membrane protease activity